MFAPSGLLLLPCFQCGINHRIARNSERSALPCLVQPPRMLWLLDTRHTLWCIGFFLYSYIKTVYVPNSHMHLFHWQMVLMALWSLALMSNPQAGNFGNGKYAPSVCSLVASADPDATLWIHSFRVQPRGNELIEKLGEMLLDVLKKRSQHLVCYEILLAVTLIICCVLCIYCAIDMHVCVFIIVVVGWFV